MGVGLPFALGAKLAKREKQVVCLHGDGSFGLNAMETRHAVRHKLPVLIVISLNGGSTADPKREKPGRELGYTLRKDGGGARLLGRQCRQGRGHARPALVGAQREVDKGRVAVVNVRTDYRTRAGTLRSSPSTRREVRDLKVIRDLGLPSGLLGDRRPRRRTCTRGRCGRRSTLAGPAHERAGLAGVLIKDNEVEEELAAHVLFANRVVGDVVVLRPFGNVLIEEVLGILGGTILAIVVNREGQRRAARRSGAGADPDNGDGDRKRSENRVTAH